MTDDDERMDRAQRIREMREGSRPNDEAQDDDRTDAGDDATDSGEASPDGSAAGDPSTDESSGPERAAETEADGGPAADDGGAGDRPDESAAADQSTGATEATDGPADETADDAVAEAAAEAVAGLDIDEEAVSGGDDEDGDDTIHIPGADVGDVDVDVEEMARQAGLSSADSASEDGDPADGAGASEMGIGAAGRAAAAETETGEETRVLEFALGDEQYCLDIEYVEEIVKRETVTRVPNTPDCVEGVVDLRGQITTILDPKVLLDIDETGSKDLIVVFDPEAFDDQGAVGWVVDDVNQVTPITEDEVNDSPVDQDHINGVVDRDGEFVIWTTPELDLDEVAG